MTDQTQQLHTEDIATGAPRRDDNPVGQRANNGERGLANLIGDTSQFATRWDAIQTGFVDEPRRAVEEADALVAQVIQRLAESFSTERTRLEAQWSRGDQVNTEDLRVALQRYRTFFQQLLLREPTRPA
jgi:hypothetical protein